RYNKQFAQLRWLQNRSVPGAALQGSAAENSTAIFSRLRPDIWLWSQCLSSHRVIHFSIAIAERAAHGQPLPKNNRSNERPVQASAHLIRREHSPVGPDARSRETAKTDPLNLFMKFAFVSQGLPPSWSGQSVV